MAVYRMRMVQRMGRRTARTVRGRRPIITGTKNVNNKVSRAQDHGNGFLQDEDGGEDGERTARTVRGWSPIITGTKNVNHKVSRAQDHGNGCIQDEDGGEDGRRTARGHRPTITKS
jgi:hypothetical protein